MICEIWYVRLWYVRYDMWDMICEIWYVRYDICDMIVRYDMWDIGMIYGKHICDMPLWYPFVIVDRDDWEYSGLQFVFSLLSGMWECGIEWNWCKYQEQEDPFSSRKLRASTPLQLIPFLFLSVQHINYSTRRTRPILLVNRSLAGLEDDECDLESWIYRPESAYMSESGGMLESGLDEEKSEFDDSTQLLTFDDTATRFLGKP